MESDRVMTLFLQGRGAPLEVTPDGPLRIIGERINPSGKKRLREALIHGDWDFVLAEACRQVEAGADVIDVNVGGKGIDEEAVLPEAVRRIADCVEAPLSIDTRAPKALEKALAACPGRPLINSIGGEERILAENLPIIAARGVPVIVLCMGQGGIPKDTAARLEIARRVMERALAAGVREEDILFDPLVMTVGPDDQAGRIVLETIRQLRKEFPGHSITGGASNISFDMPIRPVLNAHFLVAATTLGMNIPITDPTDSTIRYAMLTSDLFRGKDRGSRRFMRYYRQNLPVVSTQ
jgi:5-methyltetrahydrofolate--homocysteine methyltransferase